MEVEKAMQAAIEKQVRAVFADAPLYGVLSRAIYDRTKYALFRDGDVWGFQCPDGTNSELYHSAHDMISALFDEIERRAIEAANARVASHDELPILPKLARQPPSRNC